MNGNPKIDLSEKFPHLLHAPIVEAVVEMRAQAQSTWEENTVRSHFEPKLPGYAWLDSQREILHQLRVEPGQPPKQNLRELGFKGVRFKSGDGLHIVQFNKDGFVFSRLHPYDRWEQLIGESLRLWRPYAEYARPVEIHRLGLRFINRFQLPVREARFEDYILPAPQPPPGLDVPFLGFMHQDTLAVPGYKYAINVIRTIQPPVDFQAEGVAVIVDIDVFTTDSFEARQQTLEPRLLEMRWLKNKTFFGSITDKALKTFQ